MAWHVFTPPPGTEMCDFCSASPTHKLYPCRNFVVPRNEHTVFHGSVGAWSACERCAVLIDAGRWSQLTDRSVRKFARVHGVPRNEWGEIRQQLSEIHSLFCQHMIREA